jgi:hypothetical protein
MEAQAMLDWQTIAVALTVIAAVVYLLRHALGKHSRRGGCGNCRCEGEKPKPLISSGDLVSRLRPRN